MKRFNLGALRTVGAMSVFVVGMMAQAQVVSPANQMRQILGESQITTTNYIDRLQKESQSKIQTELHRLLIAIENAAGNRPFAMHEFLGYSGADYADKEGFKNDFRRIIKQVVAKTKANLGSEAVTVLALGGTVDGFGVGYDIIDDLKKTGQIKDVIVVGLVSDQAVQYHAEGIEKGWGDVISPKQDFLYLADTYTKDGSKVWELKSSPTSASDTVRFLLDSRRSSYSVMHVMEGGEQAFKESVEMLLEAARDANAGVKTDVEMKLYAGYREGKPKKMKGYKAATQMTYLLLKYPGLQPANVSVSVTSPGVVHSALPLSIFRDAARGFWTNPDIAASDAEVASRSEEEAKLRKEKFAEAFSKTDAIALEQLDLAANRLQEGIRSIESALNRGDHRIHDDARAERSAEATVQAYRAQLEVIRAEKNQILTKTSASSNAGRLDARIQRAMKAQEGVGESVRASEVVEKARRK